MSRKKGPGPTDYEIGYGRPPAEYRWSKGVSGNPRGRKKGSITIGDILRQKLLLASYHCFPLHPVRARI